MRILIADDHRLFRDSLRSLLQAGGFEVVGEAADGLEAVNLSWRLEPDVVLMDLRMPGMNGLDAIRRLTVELPDLRVVVLTASDDESDLFEAIKAGAKGYLSKDLSAERFFDLLEGLGRGEPALTPHLARKLLEEFARDRSADDPGREPAVLTEREMEILELMVDGVTSNRDLSERLGVSENTIKFHVRNILDKLHLHNRAQVVAYALRHQLVSASLEEVAEPQGKR